MIIRKVSIGADYKSSVMHYIVGQAVLSGSHKIHLIRYDDDGVKIWIERPPGEILLWKQFNPNMPVSIEYNIDF
jgi:hypothetical protein